MNKIILAITLLFIGITTSYSQSTQNVVVFKIITLGNQYNESVLKEAMLNADWCGMINPDNEYTLTFDDGSVVEMLSEKNLKKNMIQIDPSCVREVDFKETATYGISPNGYILRMMSKSASVKSIN